MYEELPLIRALFRQAVRADMAFRDVIIGVDWCWLTSSLTRACVVRKKSSTLSRHTQLTLEEKNICSPLLEFSRIHSSESLRKTKMLQRILATCFNSSTTLGFLRRIRGCHIAKIQKNVISRSRSIFQRLQAHPVSYCFFFDPDDLPLK